MKIINATINDQSQLLKFLEDRGFAENVWLIHNISEATSFDDSVGQVYICKDNEHIAGVACASWYSGRPGEDCMIRLDAEGEESFTRLVNAFPESKSQLIIIMNAGVKQYMDNVPGYERTDRDLYYTVNPEQFQPVVAISSDNIMEVTEECKHLFDGCENPPRWEYKSEDSQIDAYILNDRVASSISTSPITPVLPSGYQAVSVGALYTQTEFRHRGYARELVSVVTQRILSEGNMPIYWTDQDNVASQALCISLGYQLYGLEVAYHR